MRCTCIQYTSKEHTLCICVIKDYVKTLRWFQFFEHVRRRVKVYTKTKYQDSYFAAMVQEIPLRVDYLQI